MIRRKYPEQPILSAGAIVFKGSEVLLVKRGKEPAKGLWSIPGGVLHVGERISEGLEREVLEETGIAIRFGGLVDIIERIFYDDDERVVYHYVILDYWAEFAGGTPAASSDADDALFVPIDKINTYRLTEGLGEVIHKARSLRETAG